MIHYRVLIIAACLVSTAYAAPAVKTAYTNYDVYLAESKNLREDLNLATPVVYDGKPFHGYTDWRVSWQYRWQPTDGGCRIGSVTTTVAITYTLPNAVTLPLDQRLREAYDAYLVALTAHEKGHGRIGIDAAKAIERALDGMLHAGDCRQLADIANAKANEILDKYKQLNRDYDQKTSYGKTQGAVLKN